MTAAEEAIDPSTPPHRLIELARQGWYADLILKNPQLQLLALVDPGEWAEILDNSLPRAISDWQNGVVRYGDGIHHTSSDWRITDRHMMSQSILLAALALHRRGYTLSAARARNWAKWVEGNLYNRGYFGAEVTKIAAGKAPVHLVCLLIVTALAHVSGVALPQHIAMWTTHIEVAKRRR
jgi:hypothetical protein